MNFSETLKVTGSQLKWSPDGRFLAVAVIARLEIRDGDSQHLLCSFCSNEYIQGMEWSADSSLIFTTCYKRGVVEIWNPLKQTWRCKIDEGAMGLIAVSWSPDSRHILTTADLYLRTTIWSLAHKMVQYINNPKNITNGLQFSHDGLYLSIALRINCKDIIQIFETKSWSQVKKFEVATQDLAGLLWSPDDSVLAIWDSPSQYKLLIYTPSGHSLSTYCAYEWALGIKTVCWAPSSQFLAIGSFDNKIRLMNYITWKIISEFEHPTTIDDQFNCSIFNEKNNSTCRYSTPLETIQNSHSVPETTYEAEESRPVNLVTASCDRKKISSAVSRLCFSADGRHLASKVDALPSVVWIWSIAKLSLHTILVHQDLVKDFSWNDRQTCLGICTGGHQIYIFTPYGCLTAAVPKSLGLQINNLRWHSSGAKLALVGKDLYSICYINSNLEGATQ